MNFACALLILIDGISYVDMIRNMSLRQKKALPKTCEG